MGWDDEVFVSGNDDEFERRVRVGDKGLVGVEVVEGRMGIYRDEL
ncbi:hypothetical protein [Bacillus velezensis]|nr:hypothetical protein [Bacillus velezensis]